MKLAALALVAVALPGNAFAQDQKTVEAKPAKAAKPRNICRRDANTGTRMAKQTCHTAEEWAQIDGAGSNAASDAMDRQRRGN